MRDFAISQLDALLRRFSAQVNHTALQADADAVHDLRVAIRRLSRALRAFAQFLPGKEWKRIRKQLSHLMDAAANVRNHDIAMELVEKAGMGKPARIWTSLQVRRRESEVELRSELQLWQARHFAQEWRQALEL